MNRACPVRGSEISSGLPSWFSAKRFRFSQLFRIVAINQLTPAERQQLGDVSGGDDLTAVLLPTMPGLSAKAICGNTARLLEDLRNPSTFSPVGLAAGDGQSVLLVKLVLDSVLEIEYQGQFVSGAAAADLFEFAPEELAGDNRGPWRISQEALRYAESLALSEAPMLSARLYFYNRMPLSPQWTQRIPSPEAVTRWLGLEAGSPLCARVERVWIDTPPLPENPGWRQFRSHCCAGGASYKLYVNPQTEFFREALAEAVPVFEEYGFSAFKLGRDLPAVLRPDKLVAYAQSRKQIDSAAAALLRRLRGMPPQVVPFTAAIDDEGLLSWGIDPPRAERVSTWQGTSWRRWITDRLAVALIAARASGAPSPSQFALQRLAVEGIDVRSWTPADLEWACGVGE